MVLVTRARAAGILAICLLVLGAPGAMAVPAYQPDARIRLGSGSDVGDNYYSPMAQAVTGTGDIGDKLTFWITIKNRGTTDSFKAKRSSGFTNGYRVRYYSAGGKDVTGQVNTGTFTTPSLLFNQEYVMRATVKVRSLATPCSYTSRLITVSSVANPAARDAVRFTGALATPDLNCAPVAVNDTASITENELSVTGSLWANDIDPDGDPIIFWDLGGIPGLPVYGLIGWNPSNGGYVWTLDNDHPAVDALNDGETLTQVIVYTVHDGTVESNEATLTITIHGVTDNACVRHAGAC